jgi:hypothetical protein
MEMEEGESTSREADRLATSRRCRAAATDVPVSRSLLLRSATSTAEGLNLLWEEADGEDGCVDFVLSNPPGISYCFQGF